MQFFLEFFIARLREQGWPRSEGILKRRRYVTESAFVGVLQDVIRIALALGSCLPDSAKRIAITYMSVDESTNQHDVEQWIDSASAMGEEKVDALSELHPQWLRFTALTVEDQSGNAFHRVWAGSDDRFDMNEAFSGEGLAAPGLAGLGLVAIAMGWALRHPEEAKNALGDWSNEQGAVLLQTFGAAIDVAEQPNAEISTSKYQSWEQLAQGSVTWFVQTNGLPDFNDRSTWSG